VTPGRRARGTGLVELLVGTLLALAVLSALTAAVATGARLLLACSARGEAEDTAQLALEALAFDVRRAGYDPAAGGVVAVREADADRLALAADLDGDGAVDDTSEEAVAYVCAPGARRLSRLVGRQSLPLADGVLDCRFRYLDRAGTPMAIPPGGLDAAARDRLGAIALDLVLLPTGLAGRVERSVVLALRTTS
jgi:Tfp pilus assembly protein PilW